MIVCRAILLAVFAASVGLEFLFEGFDDSQKANTETKAHKFCSLFYSDKPLSSGEELVFLDRTMGYFSHVNSCVPAMRNI